ncbi:AbfB domain-containing protein [Crossiella sp. CA198]|uniref:AbfB domain-containing protein n=1 Tax=Crossiella sp. CA198 TaxID=3455607 RepID=UPI003F8D0AE5
MPRPSQGGGWAAGSLTVVIATMLLGATAANAISNGTSATDSEYAFAARVHIGEQACSGALVDPQWVVTAASCFPGNPQGTGVAAPEGTTATIGRANRFQTTGQVVRVTELARYAGRDLVLAKLADPVNGIAPLRLATTAPVAGEVLRVAGFGRSATEWVPERLQSARFAVGAVAPATFSISGHTPAEASTCKGDSGGPAFRERDGRAELVGINSNSWQRGCLGTSTTNNGATEVRVDDIGGWITEQIDKGRRVPGVVQNAIVDFRGVHSGRCLDVYFASWENDARTVIANCHGRANQQWEVIERGQNRYSFKSVNSKKCLEITGGAGNEGAPVGQHECRGDLTRQEWELLPAKDGATELRNRATGKVVQPAGSGTGEGTFLVQAENRHASDQQWTVRVVSKARHDLVTPAQPNRSLRVTNQGLPNRYARHARGEGWIDLIEEGSPELDKADATWRIVPGLADGNCYSVEAGNLPGNFLRHAQGRIRLDRNDGSAQLTADATWCARDGLDGRGVSLESWNLPDRFIRHTQGQLWSARNGGDQWYENPNSFAADTTWDVVEPLKK